MQPFDLASFHPTSDHREELELAGETVATVYISRAAVRVCSCTYVATDEFIPASLGVV